MTIGIQSKIFEKSHYHLSRDILNDGKFEEIKKQSEKNAWNLYLWDKMYDNGGVLETGFWWNAAHIDPIKLYDRSLMNTDDGIEYIKNYNPPEDFITLFYNTKKPKSKYKQIGNPMHWGGVVFAAQNPYDRSVKGPSTGRDYTKTLGVVDWFLFFERCCSYYGDKLLVKLHPLHKDGKKGETEIRQIASKYKCTVEHTDHTCLEKCDHVVLACSTFSVDCMMRKVRVKQGMPGYFYKTGAVTFCDMDPKIECNDTVDMGLKLCNFMAWKYCVNATMPLEWWKQVLLSYEERSDLFPLQEKYSYAGHLKEYNNP